MKAEFTDGCGLSMGAGGRGVYKVDNSVTTTVSKLAKLYRCILYIKMKPKVRDGWGPSEVEGYCSTHPPL